MSDNRFVKALNEQIAYEFGASQQYAAVAVHYDAETLPRLAAHFYRLSLEEERRVTAQINALAGLAREHGDYAGEQFMQWFIKEQVEEVSSMSDLLRVVERTRENP